MSVEETRPILAPDAQETHDEPKSRGLGKLAIATALFGMLYIYPSVAVHES